MTGAPPPSPALLALVRDMKPVETRPRFRAITEVAAWSLLAVGASGHVPSVWGLGAFLVCLGFALVPAAGQVAPDEKRAALVGILTTLVLLLTPAAPLRVPSLVITTVPFLLGIRALRQVLPMGSWRVGVALGASAAALLPMHPIQTLLSVTIGAWLAPRMLRA